jgi:hypothetical protein
MLFLLFFTRGLVPSFLFHVGLTSMGHITWTSCWIWVPQRWERPSCQVMRPSVRAGKVSSPHADR